MTILTRHTTWHRDLDGFLKWSPQSVFAIGRTACEAGPAGPMPLTIAHPAAVIPFARVRRGWAVPSALVIGSVAPDFAYRASYWCLSQC